MVPKEPRDPVGANWADGRILSPGESAVRADDHSVVVGDGVFETTGVLNGVPFALTRHLARLVRSAAGLGICLLYTSPSPRDKRQSRMPSSA